MRVSVAIVGELGNLFTKSQKFRQSFLNIFKVTHKLKPLCPARFLCRLSVIVTVLEQYKEVMASLVNLTEIGSSEVKSKARSLFKAIQKEKTYLGLQIAKST